MLKVSLCLTGVCPERALARLNRAGITVFNAVKKDPTTLQFCVKKADEKKVFSIYPHASYQKGSSYAYSVRRLPSRGGLRLIEKGKRRIGVLLGALVFVVATLVGEEYVWKIDVDAPAVYLAQVTEVLNSHGIKQNARYQKGKEDLVCSSLLALDGVSYCSVKKSGSVVYVLIKTNSFALPKAGKDFLADRAGTLLKLVVLRGTPLVEEGQEIALSEKLVEGALYTQEGDREEVRIVAYAQIACAYTGVYDCESEKEAFAKAYLEAEVTAENARVQASVVEKKENAFQVTISYTWTQSIGIG